jgi:hypothetical protein
VNITHDGSVIQELENRFDQLWDNQHCFDSYKEEDEEDENEYYKMTQVQFNTKLLDVNIFQIFGFWKKSFV